MTKLEQIKGRWKATKFGRSEDMQWLISELERAEEALRVIARDPLSDSAAFSLIRTRGQRMIEIAQNYFEQ